MEGTYQAIRSSHYLGWQNILKKNIPHRSYIFSTIFQLPAALPTPPPVVVSVGANPTNDSHSFSVHLFHSQTPGCFVFDTRNMHDTAFGQCTPIIRRRPSFRQPMSRTGDVFDTCIAGAPWSGRLCPSMASHARLGLGARPHRHP